MKFTVPLTLSEIASFIGATMDGDPEFPVTGMNEIHMVESGDLTFVDHPKYYTKALNSKATTIIINKQVSRPDGKALLICEKPFDAYVLLAKKLRGFEPAVALISPSAIIGEGTVIQPGAFIGNHVVVGKHCIIHANSSIYDHTRIGDHVIIHSGAVLGADAFYYQKRQEGWTKLESCGRVVVGDNVEIGALTSVDKGVSGDTVISSGVKIDNHVQIGHDTFIGRDCLIGSHSAIAGVTRIEDNVIIWANCLINKDLVIGSNAVLMAMTGTERSLEGGKVYYGIPADDVRKKWREIAALKQLPEFMRKVAKELKLNY